MVQKVFVHPIQSLAIICHLTNRSTLFVMYVRSPALLLPLLSLSSPVLAGVQEIWWNITYVQDANPDGLFERRVIGVNGTWPYVFFSC